MITIIEFLLLRFAMPMIIEYMRRRDLDPDFKRLSDDLFHDWKDAKTTVERKSAVRKLHELQKS